ncbi:amidohydrolase family protein, partial [Desulfovibrio sp.]|uniref:amidohydrolase family protein n=2 Tax=Desulfovibrio sp. TaxID=885 RepID=UPI003FD7F722
STYAIQSTNDDVLQCMAAAPDLFIGFWAYDPHKGMTAVRRFRKAVLEDGIRGAAIAHCAVDDAKFYPLYAMCCEFDVPVIMTAGLSPFMPKVVLDSTDPRHIDRVATDFPELKILFSHGGYPWVLEAIALVLRHSNVYMDFSTCESKLMGQNYIQAANEYITDKVVFASANPFVEVHKAVEKYQRLDLTEECRRKLFYENGMKLLGLSSL